MNNWAKFTKRSVANAMRATRTHTLVSTSRSKPFVRLSSLFLASSLFAASHANAELTELDSDSLSQITGRAGLTIDIETQMTIGEIEYVDAGSMYTRDISLTGIGGGYVDNIRARLDITDGTETLLAGFADAALLANLGYLDASEADVAWALAEYDDGAGGYGKQFADGDLFIHVSSVTMGQDFTTGTGPVAGTEAANLDSFKNAVDLHYQEGSFGLQASDDSIETDLSRNFSIEAYLGYLDILITNRGNSFNTTTTDGQPKDIQLQDSYISLDLKFRVEDLDIDHTNIATNTFIPRDVTTPGLTLRDMRIHNERGADSLGSFGFASIESKIAAASGILHVLESAGQEERVDGQAIYDINVKMDWDLPHVSFGDTGDSIGEVYLTDFQISDTSLVISAH